MWNMVYNRYKPLLKVIYCSSSDVATARLHIDVESFLSPTPTSYYRSKKAPLRSSTAFRVDTLMVETDHPFLLNEATIAGVTS